jgi:lactoylglutathione lyase
MTSRPATRPVCRRLAATRGVRPRSSGSRLISTRRGVSGRYGCSVPRLGHVILFVGDLAGSVGFYRDVVGLEHRFTDAGYAEFGTGPTRLALYERRRAEWLTGHPVLPGPAGEIVLIVKDVDVVAAALRARGIPLLSWPADRPWGHRTLHIADPDGFVVEFAQEIPRARSRRADATGSPAG